MNSAPAGWDGAPWVDFSRREPGERRKRLGPDPWLLEERREESGERFPDFWLLSPGGDFQEMETP
jgi:hypothetical protein